MPKNSDGVEQPEVISTKKYRDAYDQINWSVSKRCCACNSKIDSDHYNAHPFSYIVHKDGAIEHSNCNFN